MRTEYDSWVEGVPMYSVRGDHKLGLMVETGTSYPSQEERNEVLLRLVIPGGTVLTRRDIRAAMTAARRKLYAIVEGNSSVDAAGRLGLVDDHMSIPDVGDTDPDNMLTVFWLRHPDRPHPILGIRSRYNQGAIAALKECLQSVGHYAWLPRPWRLWTLSSARYATALLGRLKSSGFKLRWVDREGFPPAPPVGPVQVVVPFYGESPR